MGEAKDRRLATPYSASIARAATGASRIDHNAARTSWVFVMLYTNTRLEGVGKATPKWRESTMIDSIREARRF